MNSINRNRFEDVPFSLYPEYFINPLKGGSVSVLLVYFTRRNVLVIGRHFDLYYCFMITDGEETKDGHDITSGL